MPKQKTNKSAKKRFKMTANGKLMYKQGGKKHLNAHMSSKRKRRLRGAATVSADHHDKTMLMFPYAKYAR